MISTTRQRYPAIHGTRTAETFRRKRREKFTTRRHHKMRTIIIRGYLQGLLVREWVVLQGVTEHHHLALERMGWEWVPWAE